PWAEVPVRKSALVTSCTPRPQTRKRSARAQVREPRALTCQAAGGGVQLRPAGELSLLFSAAVGGLGLYASANQAPTAKTMPMTSEPAARSGWCPVEPSMCPGTKLGSDLAGSAM